MTYAQLNEILDRSMGEYGEPVGISKADYNFLNKMVYYNNDCVDASTVSLDDKQLKRVERIARSLWKTEIQ